MEEEKIGEKSRNQLMKDSKFMEIENLHDKTGFFDLNLSDSEIFKLILHKI